MARVAARGEARQAASSTRSSMLFWLVGLLCGAAVMFSPGTLILSGTLFAPLLAVVLTETSATRASTRAAGLAVIAATLHLFVRYWSSGASVEDALAMLEQPGVVVSAWTAIGGAWLSVEVLAVGLRVGFELAMRATEARQQSEIEGLIEEWGPAAAEGSDRTAE